MRVLDGSVKETLVSGSLYRERKKKPRIVKPMGGSDHVQRFFLCKKKVNPEPLIMFRALY